MATQGAAHEAMAEAFVCRLKQLYPNAEYREGKVIRPVGLKPDVYVRHPDGREWVYEMVHGNRQAEHMLQNHHRYQQANIQDYWILWDELFPKAGKKFSDSQGLLASLLTNRVSVHLTKPCSAILEMQESQERFLYAFSVNATGLTLNSIPSALLASMAVGVRIMRFNADDLAGQVEVRRNRRVPTERFFTSMAELQFNENGSLQLPKENSMEAEAAGKLLKGMGLDSNSGYIPAVGVDEVQRMITDPTRYSDFTKAILEAFLKRASPDELAEIAAYAQSGRATEVTPYQGRFPADLLPGITYDPELMLRLADDVKGALEHLEHVELPSVLKRFLVEILNAQKFESIAEFMKLQAESDAFRRVGKKGR